ncbi:hypothetical protein EB796_013399 [Bugula neritina]|uniref:Uncharacterized protein n=1 Tax=Bugula neritina TaxID=10212 RepID=A0A7J7JQS4_BUGNE|nr:hypothetical protein EB796_013399 [Bugula neritina]
MKLLQLNPEPSHQTYHYNDDVKGRLRAGVTHNTTSSAVAPRHPVKRTASMPASMHPAKGPQRHQGSVRHSQDKYPLHTQSSRVLLRNETADGDSRRPGRGVFTSSGKRVHEGRRMSRDDQHRVKDFSSVEVPYNGTSHDLPPRLPARNSSSDRHQFRSPDRNYPKYVDKSSPRRGVSLDRSLTENMAASRAYSSKESHNSESNHKPIDHLRDRVRRQQEKEQQRPPHSHNNPGSTISPVSHPATRITSGHPTSPEAHYSDSPSQELSPASVSYNGQYSHQYSHHTSSTDLTLSPLLEPSLSAPEL